MAEICCKRLAGKAGRKKSPSGHHRTTLSDHIFETKALSTIGKNWLNSSICSICLHNMVNFGPLTAEIDWRVWSTLANFNGLRVLAPLLHGTPVLVVSQTLRRWTEGATYVWQGDHHVGIGQHSTSCCNEAVKLRIICKSVQIKNCKKNFKTLKRDKVLKRL